MSPTLLITRPDHDDITHYLFRWSEEIISAAEARGIKVLDLAQKKATREQFESMIEKNSPKFIVLSGHGDYNTVTGHNREPILIAGENEKFAKSKIVYAVSCSSAKTLGLKSIEAGAESYTGYDDVFFLIYEPDKISRPLEDGTAKLFLEHSNLFAVSIIKGNSAKESFNRSKNILKLNAARLMASQNSGSSMARYLWWNFIHFVSHGNVDTKI